DHGGVPEARPGRPGAEGTDGAAAREPLHSHAHLQLRRHRGGGQVCRPHPVTLPVTIAWDRAGLVHPNGHRALVDVSIQVGRGERVAIIGPSGAGKTSLLRLAGTALRPTEGGVTVLGEAPWSLSPRAL